MECSATSNKSDPVKEKAGWLKLQQARGWVKKEYPWFYNTLIGLIPKSDPHQKTLGVTRGMVMKINLEWFSTLETDIAGGCLIHEVQHVLRDLSRIHALPDFKRAAYAFDMPINDDLKKFGIKLPPFAVYSSSHNFPPGLTGEKYYELLENEIVEIEGVCAGGCGCTDQEEDPDERPEQEVQYFKKRGASDMRDFLKAKGFSAGDYPGSWSEFLEVGQEPPIVPWQKVVNTAACRSVSNVIKGHSDYSLRHPAKRSYAVGMLRPGFITSSPTIIYIEDSSGSMSHQMLKDGRNEFCGAMKQLGITEVWFLNADVTVQTQPRRISVNELRKLPVVGRGGTAFGPAITAAMKLRPKPDLIFYGTDGGGSDSRTIVKPKNVEFIWLIVPSSYSTRPCSWGTQILMSNDRAARKKFEILK